MFYDKKTQTYIDEAVNAELKTALEQIEFVNLRHACSVLQEHFDVVIDNMNMLYLHNERFWKRIRYLYNKDVYKYDVQSLQHYANEAIKELCQVIAVLEKTQRQLLNEETQK